MMLDNLESHYDYFDNSTVQSDIDMQSMVRLAREFGIDTLDQFDFSYRYDIGKFLVEVARLTLASVANLPANVLACSTMTKPDFFSYLAIPLSAFCNNLKLSPEQCYYLCYAYARELAFYGDVDLAEKSFRALSANKLRSIIEYMSIIPYSELDPISDIIENVIKAHQLLKKHNRSINVDIEKILAFSPQTCWSLLLANLLYGLISGIISEDEFGAVVPKKYASILESALGESIIGTPK